MCSLFDNLDKSLIFEMCLCSTSSIPDKPTLEIQLEEPAPFCSRVNSLNLLNWHPVWSTSPTFTCKLGPNHPQASAASQLLSAEMQACLVSQSTVQEIETEGHTSSLLVYCGLCASAFVGA